MKHRKSLNQKVWGSQVDEVNRGHSSTNTKPYLDNIQIFIGYLMIIYLRNVKIQDKSEYTIQEI